MFTLPFSAQAEIPFRLYGLFCGFLAGSLKVTIFSPGLNLDQVIATVISRGFLSEVGLKFVN